MSVVMHLDENHNIDELPPIKQIGIVLSFTMTHDQTPEQDARAEEYLRAFASSVAELVKQGFPKLKHTIVSKQEYMTPERS